MRITYTNLYTKETETQHVLEKFNALTMKVQDGTNYYYFHDLSHDRYLIYMSTRKTQHEIETDIIDWFWLPGSRKSLYRSEDRSSIVFALIGTDGKIVEEE